MLHLLCIVLYVCLAISVFLLLWTRRCFFVVRMELPCLALWRPEALDCRVPIPREAWN